MTVHSSDFVALIPVLIVAGSTVVVMIGVALRRNYDATVILTLIGLATAFSSLWAAKQAVPRHVTPLLMLDRYALFYIGLITAASIAIVLISYGYFKKIEGDQEELYILLLDRK